MPEASLVPVDFFGIGGIRCASTWFATCLDEHPQIRLAEGKEPNRYVRHLEVFARFDEPNFLRDEAWYSAQFEPWSSGQILGDFSVKLFHNTDTAPALIQQHHPNARFFVLLRDPVARAYSHYHHHRNGDQGRDTAPATFAQAIQHDPFVRHSRYHEQLVGWLVRFPLDRFHIVLDTDLKADPARVMSEAYRFVGVDADFVAPSLHARLNKPSTRRGLARGVGRITAPLRKIGMGRALDVAARLGLQRVQDRLDRKPVVVPPIDPGDAARLRAMLLADIEHLEALIGRDLSAWKGDDA